MSIDYPQQTSIEVSGEVPELRRDPADLEYIYSCSKCINSGRIAQAVQPWGPPAFLLDTATGYYHCRVCWTPHRRPTAQKELF